VGVLYEYPNGKKFNYHSVMNNHYGVEFRVYGDKSTVELEKGRHIPNEKPGQPAIEQLIMDIENSLFRFVPLGGTSWILNQEEIDPIYYLDNAAQADEDATFLELAGFVRSVKSATMSPEHLKECYYATIAGLMGYESILQRKRVDFPEALAFENR